ncbi:MAG: hypothetical protein J5688_04100 [Paludibacteraceae bacterium]|nr:hypothetical protein [Paludibacteraceae bacterium]
MTTDELRSILHERYPEMDAVSIRQEDIVFEERVRLKCFHCRNYMGKWTCPGHIPQLDYRKLVGEYAHLAVVISRSAMELHKAMLYLEAELLKRNNPLAQSFIGGCCELCEGGCAPDRCAHPEQARIPWDAIGCNVTRSLANIGIQVDFTGKDNCRYGLLVW